MKKVMADLTAKSHMNIPKRYSLYCSISLSRQKEWLSLGVVATTVRIAIYWNQRFRKYSNRIDIFSFMIIDFRLPYLYINAVLLLTNISIISCY